MLCTVGVRSVNVLRVTIIVISNISSGVRKRNVQLVPVLPSTGVYSTIMYNERAIIG